MGNDFLSPLLLNVLRQKIPACCISLFLIKMLT